MVQSSGEAQLQQQPQPTETETGGSEDATLSHAHQVGQEFVYIYYMCVNKCPRDLHRFYSTASYFVHGGREPPGSPSDPPISGQTAIATKIASLEFRDCRTKILMVDSLPAPANGVLIQVCGEISNNAGPMRRFMQTFLLAPNGPKKYFVQNDIFRYQDEVFINADVAASDGETADVVGLTDNGIAGEADAAEAEPTIDDAAAADKLVAPEEVLLDDGHGNPIEEDANVANEQEGEEGVNIDGDVGSSAKATAGQSVTEEPAESTFDDELAPSSATANDSESQQQKPPAQPLKESASAAQAPSGGKKNFAALFGGPAAQQQIVQTKPRRQATPAGGPVQTNGNHSAASASAPSAAVASGAGEHPVVAQPPFSAPGERRERGPEAPDHLQIFVGNLAPEVREKQLTEIFSEYGEVTACRITFGKMRSTHFAAPNFGFVSFASASSVKAAVSQPPVYKEHRINVEEKRSGGGGGYRRGGGGGGGGRVGGYGGGRGGYSSGGQNPRR